MPKKKKDHQRLMIETLVRVGAPADLVKLYEILTRPFYRMTSMGRWPLRDRNRCCAFFAAAAIEKIVGSPVDTIHFIGPNDSLPNCGHQLEDYLNVDYGNNLWMKLGAKNFQLVCRRSQSVQLDSAIKLTGKNLGPMRSNQIPVYLALAAAAGDRELFAKLQTVAIAMQDMLIIAEDVKNPRRWFVLAG